MHTVLQSKLKPTLPISDIREENGIPILLNPLYTTGENEKFRKMYDWMSRGYDFVETVVGRLKYGNSINRMRQDLMSRLEWRNHTSVLYVSIGTGKDLKFIPEGIDTSTLDITGVDISMGMLQKCRKNFRGKLSLSLVQCCAEDLPFADETFDIVFHVGGINFFNDKPLAIQEMIRVAKPGTKIMISDETADYVDEQYKKSQLSKGYFDGVHFDLKDITSAIPANVRELKTDFIWNNRFYAITFRK